MWFKKKDPICGMKQEANKGTEKYGQWFCSNKCLESYETALKKTENRKAGCC